MDYQKQSQFWASGAEEDWEVAWKLVSDGKTRHGLFFAHLSLEKYLKALVTKKISDLAPRIHNLVRLAELAQLDLGEDQMGLLAEMNQFNLEGRYPDFGSPVLTGNEAMNYLNRASQVKEWLIQKL